MTSVRRAGGRPHAHPDPGVVDAIGLLAAYGDELVVQTVRDTHRAVAKRVYRALGRAGAPSRPVHDGVSAALYGGVGLGLGMAGRALDAVGRAGVGPRLEASPRGRFVRSAVVGLVGDRIRDEGHPLHFEMAVRVAGADVPVDRAGLADAFPDSTGRLAVFVHGLCETEAYWNRGGSPTYADTVSALGWTPVFLRANTGLPLADNGVALASLLQGVTEAWPTDVGRIALVGHSMGGLLVRAGLAVATAAEEPWPHRVTDVVTLGTPHLGAPLARQASAGASLLSAFPESAAFGRVIDRRSAGIMALEAGLADEAPYTHIRYRLVSAGLRRPWDLLMGDLLVRPASAHGRSGATSLFADADVVHLPGSNHFDLLNHPAVHRRLEQWLEPGGVRSGLPTETEAP